MNYVKYAMPITVWSSLGFIRGVNSYNYSHNKPYMYSSSFMYGMFGIMIYVNPVFLPFTIYKEFYRLEVNIRNLKFALMGYQKYFGDVQFAKNSSWLQKRLH
jgi:hypothetical protein